MRDNELIAQFMGAISEQKYSEIKDGNFYQSGVHVSYPREGLFPDGRKFHPISLLKYNTSWDWLIPVVEKIESLGTISVIIADYYCIITVDDGTAYFKETRINGRTKIEMVYDSVVEFIKWYNKNYETTRK